MSSKARQLINGSTLRIVEFFASALVGLAIMPFIISALGDKIYGLWIFIGSFLGYYGIMDFGLNSAVQRYVARATGARDDNDMNKIVNTSLAIFVVIGFVTFIMSLILALFVPYIIKNISDVAIFRICIIILGLNCAIGFPLRVFSAVLYSNMRYDLCTGVELIKLLIRTILIIVLLSRGYGIIALALITFIMDVGGYGLKYLMMSKIYKNVIVSSKYIDVSKIRPLFDYSAHAFLIQIADQLKFNIDNLVIVTFVGFSAVTLYSIGSRIIKYFRDFMINVIGITMPVFSHYDGEGNSDAIREKYIFFMKISTYLSILIGGTLIIFGKVFIIAWVGEKYLNAYYILLILLIPFIFDVIQTPGTGLLYGLSKHKYYMYINMVEAISNLALSVFLVRKYGIYGVALGTAIPLLITKVFVQPIYTCKIAGIKIREFYLHLMAPAILLSICILLICWVLIKRFIVADYLILSVLTITVLAVFAFVSYKYGFNEAEKRYFKKGLVRAS